MKPNIQSPGASAGHGAARFAPGSGGTALPGPATGAPPELDDAVTQRYPVAIVGAGITGLTMACALAQLGIAVVLLDEHDNIGASPACAGICYTQKSLEIFARLGLYPGLAAKGVQWSVGRTFAGAHEVYAFDLRQQSHFGLSGQPPFLNIQQRHIEELLVGRMAELGHVDLRWRSRVVGFSQNHAGATLALESPAGRYRLQAAHVIDASGANTPFHAWCGLGMAQPLGDDRWCTADVRFQNARSAERHSWVEAPFNDNRAVWQHPMAEDVWRIDYQLAPDADLPGAASQDQVCARLRAQFGNQAACDILRISTHTSQSQCLEQLQHGRVFFIGDSARMASPFGAQGGNAGVADADNLAWKLAAVIHGWADERLLQSFNEERLEAARRNVLLNNRTARFLRPRSGQERVFRDATISLARQYPFARQLVNTGRMAVANRYTSSRVCEPGAGQTVQNVRFCWGDGSTGFVVDLLQWAQGRLLLLVFGQLAGGAPARLQQLSQGTPVRCVQVVDAHATAQAREHVRDPLGHLQGACHVFGHAWAIVRPDGYLSATGEAVNAQLVKSIEHALGLL